VGAEQDPDQQTKTGWTLTHHAALARAEAKTEVTQKAKAKPAAADSA
jgi:ankyrin repeat protein